MEARAIPRLVRFPIERTGRERGQAEPVAEQARRWAIRIANAADADQWAIAVVGLKQVGPPDFDEIVPRRLLEGLNRHQPAAYRLTIVLRTHGRDIGIVRLGTLRPSGFRPSEARAARRVAGQAARAITKGLDAAPVHPPRASLVVTQDRPKGEITNLAAWRRAARHKEDVG